ncbi:Hypothetical predicted protein [Pelobates cultripes]|uniref:Uncharacterized protein n=1 Tax=Pelobates cultripes TaxID=61616 RepID=A0AAD1RSE0_PELCU|nr:Hypothetical predicted protein [Pelobates cultripes]
MDPSTYRDLLLKRNLLKQRRNHLYIPKIKNANQQMCHLLDQIAAAFTQYYEDLYNLRRAAQAAGRPRRSEASRAYSRTKTSSRLGLG